MRALNYIFFTLFILFALLQYNDPDPLIWMLIYGSAAIHCFFAARGRTGLWQNICILLFCGIYASYLFFASNGVLTWIVQHEAQNIAATMKADQPWIENTREFFGLLIIMLIVAINLRLRSKRARGNLTNAVKHGVPG